MPSLLQLQPNEPRVASEARQLQRQHTSSDVQSDGCVHQALGSDVMLFEKPAVVKALGSDVALFEKPAVVKKVRSSIRKHTMFGESREVERDKGR